MLFHRTTNNDDIDILLFKHFPFNDNVMMMWCGHLITKEKEYTNPEKRILRHERIHLKQAQNYSHWYKYYLRYVWEWIKGNPFIKPTDSAYYTVPFEIEAYANEHKAEYKPTKNTIKKYILKNRKKLYIENKEKWKQFCRNIK